MVGGTRGRQNHANPHLGTYSFLSHSLSANIIQYKLIKQIAVQTVSNIHTETENGKTLVHLVVLVPGVFSCSTGIGYSKASCTATGKRRRDTEIR